MTQNELAQSLSISPQAISKWERGASVPDIENLCLMAERLEVSVDTLLGGSYATEKAMIAVDGGTSKTEFILFTEHGTLLHRLLLGGCNPNVIGIDGACQVLREGLDDLFKRHAFVCGVYIGASGFGTQDNAGSSLPSCKKHTRISSCVAQAISSTSRHRHQQRAMPGRHMRNRRGRVREKRARRSRASAVGDTCLKKAGAAMPSAKPP